MKKKGMVNAGKGRRIIRVNDVRLVALGDSVPQPFDEAGQVGLAGEAGQEPVLSRGQYRGHVRHKLVAYDPL